MNLSLEDRALISDLVVAYAFAIDERDWKAFEALFTPDAHIDYRSAGGIAGTPAEVAAWMPQAISLFTWTLHSVLDAPTHGDRCGHRDRVTPHVRAPRSVCDGASEVMDVSGVYHDRVRPDAGRVAVRRTTEHTLSITGGRFAEMAAARIRT